MRQGSMHFKRIKIFTILLIALPHLAWAKPEIKIEIKVEKEVIIMENGNPKKKLVEAKQIIPEETLLYTLIYSNSGDEEAQNVAVSDPIPLGTSYINGSATETGDPTFSIDHGKTFKKPSLLTYEMVLPNGKAEKKIASPEEYNHIRWTIPKIAPGTSGQVSFKVKVNK